MMKFRLKATLKTQASGFEEDEVVGSRDFEVEITDGFYIQKLLEGNIIIGYNWYCWVKNKKGDFNYDCHRNCFSGVAYITGFKRDDIQDLIDKGWEISPKVLAWYDRKH